MTTDTPRFELTRVYADGSHDPPQIVRVTELSVSTKTSRRGFLATASLLGAGASASCVSRPPVRAPRIPPPVNAPQSPPPGSAPRIPPLSVSAAQSRQQEDASAQQESARRAGINSVHAHREGVIALAWTRGGRWLASGSRDKIIKLWAMPEGTLAKTLEGHTDEVTAVAFSPDGRWLASGSRDKTIKLWAMPEGTLAKTLEGHAKQIRTVAFSPNGQWLASGSHDRTVKLWAMPEGRLTKTLEGHTEWVTVVAFSPDGQWLASGSIDKTIKLWAIPEGTLAKTLVDHTESVMAVTFSPDGRWLASGSGDKTIKLWTVPEGRLAKTLEGHTKRVSAVAFNPEGQWLASGSDDKTITLWAMPEGTLETALFDKDALEREKKAIQFSRVTVTGQVLTYTMPCGSPIPPGATCTCNCVLGSYFAPVAKPAPTTPAGRTYTRCTCDLVCTCDQVCTCVPICQAHRLLHPDPVVRRMAEQLVLLMGKRELDYLSWAAKTASTPLSVRIRDLAHAVQSGLRPERAIWPSPETCAAYMQHPDTVIAVMAAQILAQEFAGGPVLLSASARSRWVSLLRTARELWWKKRASLAEGLIGRETWSEAGLPLRRAGAA